MQDLTASDKYTARPVRLGEPDPYPDRVAGEFVCRVVSNDMVNESNRLLVLDAPERALRARAGGSSSTCSARRRTARRCGCAGR